MVNRSFLFALLAAACAGCAGVTGGEHVEGLRSQLFDAKLEKVFAASEKALTELGLTIKSEDPATGEISASKPAGVDLVAKQVHLLIRPEGEETRVGVESRSWSVSPFYNPQGERYYREVFDAISDELKPH
jgi:hypothetical protein